MGLLSAYTLQMPTTEESSKGRTKRDYVVKVYFSDTEKALIEARAQRKGLSMTAYLRALALEDATREEPKPN